MADPDAKTDAKPNGRAERLAAALRDNLRKRKAQARDVESQAVSEPRRTPD